MISKKILKILLTGKSGAGKSTYIKMLLEKSFRTPFSEEFGGRINTTPINFRYKLKNNIEYVKIKAKLKNKEKFKRLGITNLCVALNKFCKQQIAGAKKTLDEDEQFEYLRNELQKLIFKDNIGSFNLSKLLQGNNNLKETYLDEVFNLVINQILSSIIAPQDSKEFDKIKLQELIEIMVFDNFNTEIFDSFYEYGINILKEHGYKNAYDENSKIYLPEVYEGIFNSDTLKEGLTAINVANKTKEAKERQSAIVILEEVTIEAPTWLNLGDYDYLLIIDAYGLNQDGSDKIEATIYKLLNCEQMDAVILIQKYNDNKEDLNNIVKVIGNSDAKIKLISIISKVDLIEEEEEEDIVEVISSIQDESIDRFQEYILDKDKIEIPTKSSEIHYYGTKEKANIPFITNVANEVLLEIIDYKKKNDRKFKASFNNLNSNKLLCISNTKSPFDLELAVEKISNNIKVKVAQKFYKLSYNDSYYHGNTLNYLLAYLSEGLGYSSNCKVYSDISVSPYADIKDIISEAILAYLDINEGIDVSPDDKIQLLNICKLYFNSAIFKEIQRAFVKEHLNDFYNLWYTSKIAKLQGIGRIFEQTATKEQIKKIISNALINASVDIVKNYITKY